MRCLWRYSYMRAIRPSLARHFLRYRSPSQIVGHASFPIKTGPNSYLSKFARSYQSSPPGRSTQTDCDGGLSEIYDGQVQAISHVELANPREVEFETPPKDENPPPNPSLSPDAALDKITDYINAEYAHIASPRERPVDLINRSPGKFNIDLKWTLLPKRKFHCDLKCHSVDYDVTISVAGQGYSKLLAKRAAYLFLIPELHKRDLLRRSLESVAGKSSLSSEILHQDSGRLDDVYNYAAGFGYVPKVTVGELTGGLDDNLLLVEVIIELPQHNIKAAAIGRQFEIAQSAAIARFNRQAKVYQSDNESTKSTVNEAAPLNTRNTHVFLKTLEKFYEYKRLNVILKKNNLHGTRKKPYFYAIAIYNCEEMENPVSHHEEEKARSLAYLAAGVTLLANDLLLKRRFLESFETENGKILDSAEPITTIVEKDDTIRKSGLPESFNSKNSKLLNPISPVDTVVEEDCLIAMQDTIQDMRNSGVPDDTESYQPDMEPLEERRRRIGRYKLVGEHADRKSRELSSRLKEFKSDPRHEGLRSKLQDLPMNQYRTKVLDMVQNNNYSVLIGATGSGKSTQVPQILLNYAIEEGYGAHCNIICTQPRRIAASSVARRVSEERGEHLGDTVGHHIRLDAQLPRAGGSITYCTTAILLLQLQHAPDEIFDSVSHIIIDEVHERDIDVDFLLILLKNVVKRRQHANQSVPKIVLMSATIEPDLFADYFQNESPNGTLTRCPTLKVPGRTFPVKEWYLEDLVQKFAAAYEPEELEPLLQDKDTAAYLDAIESQYQPRRDDIDTTCQGDAENFEASSLDRDSIRTPPSRSQQANVMHQEDALVPLGLACAAIAHIARTSKGGAILVFLPGLSEIDKLQTMLMKEPRLGIDFSNSDVYRIFRLHSLIPPSETDVFESLPAGCRKIILSTNIAETSVTIPEVQYVVDAGKSREKTYDQSRRISSLGCCWISKSNAKQRAGRAGRVQSGNYYALYTQQIFNSLRAVGVPQLLRDDLQEVCLRVKSQSFQTPIHEFLAQALEPPSLAQVDASVRNLQALGALDQDEEITALGRLLAKLPVHPSLGKMIILGIIFRCLDPMILMGAVGSESVIWAMGLGDKERNAAARQVFLDYMGHSNSEHIGTLNALKDARRVMHMVGKGAAHRHCGSKFIRFMPFWNILQTSYQILRILEESGLIPAGKKDGFELGGPDLNVNSSSVPLIKALLTSGVFPNMAVSRTWTKTFRTEIENKSKRLKVRGLTTNMVFTEKGPAPGKLVVFSSLRGSYPGNALFLTDVGQITPLTAMLFGGRLSGNGDSVLMDSWLPFDFQPPKYSIDLPYSPAKMVIEFRKTLDRVLAIAFRDLAKFNDPRNVGTINGHSRSSGYLADDPVRIMLAERIAEILLLESQGETENKSPPTEPRGFQISYIKGISRRDRR